jgi:hypothetical protein
MLSVIGLATQVVGSIVQMIGLNLAIRNVANAGRVPYALDAPLQNTSVCILDTVDIHYSSIPSPG